VVRRRGDVLRRRQAAPFLHLQPSPHTHTRERKGRKIRTLQPRKNCSVWFGTGRAMFHRWRGNRQVRQKRKGKGDSAGSGSGGPPGHSTRKKAAAAAAARNLCSL
jgi:hypothetical protein